MTRIGKLNGMVALARIVTAPYGSETQMRLSAHLNGERPDEYEGLSEPETQMEQKILGDCCHSCKSVECAGPMDCN